MKKMSTNRNLFCEIPLTSNDFWWPKNKPGTANFAIFLATLSLIELSQDFTSVSSAFSITNAMVVSPYPRILKRYGLVRKWTVQMNHSGGPLGESVRRIRAFDIMRDWNYSRLRDGRMSRNTIFNFCSGYTMSGNIYDVIHSTGNLKSTFVVSNCHITSFIITLK